MSSGDKKTKKARRAVRAVPLKLVRPAGAAGDNIYALAIDDATIDGFQSIEVKMANGQAAKLKGGVARLVLVRTGAGKSDKATLVLAAASGGSPALLLTVEKRE